MGNCLNDYLEFSPIALEGPDIVTRHCSYMTDMIIPIILIILIIPIN